MGLIRSFSWYLMLLGDIFFFVDNSVMYFILENACLKYRLTSFIILFVKIWIIYYMHYPHVFILYTMLHIIFICIHYICIYNEMRKIHILCIVLMGVGHKQEVIDFDGGSQMVLLSSYIKKKKRKRKEIHHLIWSVIHYSLDS